MLPEICILEEREVSLAPKMQIEVKDRRGRSPKALTHAAVVDGVAVGYGGERAMTLVVKTLEQNRSLAAELKEEFREYPEEW